MPKKRAPSWKEAAPRRRHRREEQPVRIVSRPNPWIAAVFNFLIWGTGYIYNRKRTGFGTLLSIGFILSIASLLFAPESVTVDNGPLYVSLNIIAYLLMSAGFALDAYREARK